MSKQKSFTLIELLVVIVIIGILAGVIMISTSSSIDKANIAKSKVFSESVKNSLLLNLISEFKLNEGLGTQVKDSWGTSQDGVFGCYGTGCQNPEWVTSNCAMEKCVKFNWLRNYADAGGAAGSYIRIEQSNAINLTINQSFTIEYWLNMNNFTEDFFATIMKGNFATSYGHLINQRILHIYTDDDTSPELSINNFFNTNETRAWTHIVQTFYNTQITVYKNSQTDPTFKSSSGISLTTNAYPLWIGSNNGVQYFLNGLMDNIRLYNAVLSSSQIKQNYIAGLNSLLSRGLISKNDYNSRIEFLSLK